MLELLVAGLCAGGYSCDKAAQAYYQSQPALQHQVKAKSEQAKEYVPEALLYSAPAIAAIVTGNKKTIHVSGPLYLGVSNSETMVLFKRSF